MICCEIDKKPSNIASPSFAVDMYRNLPSDTSQASAENTFFQPGYNQRINPTQSYASSSYNVAPPAFASSEHAHPGSNISHEYSPQFFVSELNSHLHGEPSSAQYSWGHAGSFYPGDTLPSVLNPCPSWDPATHPLHGHSGGIGPSSATTYPGSDPTGQSSLIEASEATSLPSVSLTAIDCFSAGSDGTPSVALHLPALQHRTLPAQRRPFEWINKNAYQNPQTQQGKTRTKDKYRVVYSDHQRLELEKEFRFSRYITIRRKAELAAQLCLSERQVKIWFQNRRAKERKASKKNTNVNSASAEEQDGMDEGDASDNSGQGGDSSPGIPPMSSSQLSPQHNEIIPYNHVNISHTTSSVNSPLEPPQGGASQQSQLPYPCVNPVETSLETNNYGQIPELDIKPLLTGANEPHRVTSSIDDITTGKQGTSPPVQRTLDDL